MNHKNLLHGLIAEEYGELATAKRPETTGDKTCGDGCTAHPRPKGALHSCPVPDEKKDKGKDKKYKAFAPAIAGWSEPPAAHL